MIASPLAIVAEVRSRWFSESKEERWSSDLHD
jgi:hypothetical protein